MKRNTIATVDARINAIRAKHGNDGAACCTCGRPAINPYRRILNGRVVEGCVDAAHGPHLYAGNGLAWHLRPEAVQLRRNELAALQGR
jgi:hypothetical protein